MYDSYTFRSRYVENDFSGNVSSDVEFFLLVSAHGVHALPEQDGPSPPTLDYEASSTSPIRFFYMESPFYLTAARAQPFWLRLLHDAWSVFCYGGFSTLRRGFSTTRGLHAATAASARRRFGY